MSKDVGAIRPQPNGELLRIDSVEKLQRVTSLLEMLKLALAKPTLQPLQEAALYRSFRNFGFPESIPRRILDDPVRIKQAIVNLESKINEWHRDTVFEIHHVPDEIMIEIILMMDMESIIHLRAVSKYYLMLVESPSLLHRLSSKLGLNRSKKFHMLMRDYDKSCLTPRCWKYHPIDECLVWAIKTGSMNEVKKMFRKGATDMDLALRKAVSGGFSEITDYLLSPLSSSSASSSSASSSVPVVKPLLRRNVNGGRIQLSREIAKMPNYLIDPRPGSVTSVAILSSIFAAAKHGDSYTMERLILIHEEKTHMEFLHFNEILEYASRGGHIHIMQMMLDRGMVDGNQALFNAATNGRYLAVLFLLNNNNLKINRDTKIVACGEAGRRGFIDIMSYIMNKYNLDLIRILTKTVEGGQIEATRYLMMNTNYAMLSPVNVHGILNIALTWGHLELSNMIFQSQPENYWEHDKLCRSAIIGGNIKMILWCEQQEPIDQLDLLKGMIGASGNGHILAVKYVLSHIDVLNIDIRFRHDMSVVDTALLRAATQGHFDIVKLLGVLRPTEFGFIQAIEAAGQAHRNDIVEWLEILRVKTTAWRH